MLGIHFMKQTTFCNQAANFESITSADNSLLGDNST